jgi:hypothetical protein
MSFAIKRDHSPAQHFLFNEGPRSRCYGRTAALRLIVQPCDEDEENDEVSSVFSPI